MGGKGGKRQSETSQMYRRGEEVKYRGDSSSSSSALPPRKTRPVLREFILCLYGKPTTTYTYTLGKYSFLYCAPHHRSNPVPVLNSRYFFGNILIRIYYIFILNSISQNIFIYLYKSAANRKRRNSASSIYRCRILLRVSRDPVPKGGLFTIEIILLLFCARKFSN